MHNFILQYSDIAKLNMQVATETTTTAAAVATATISTIVTIAATTEHQIQHHH